MADTRTVTTSTDPIRCYTAEEKLRLTQNLLQLTKEIHQGKFSDRPLDERLLCHFHAALFDGVRGHGGRMRAQGFGAERLTFGPHISFHRDHVTKEIGALFEQARNRLRELIRQKNAENFEEGSLSFGLWLHAKIIWVHPFEDGNGRSCRAILEEIVIRCGVWLPPLEVPKQEYIEALNRFYTTAQLQPLVDLYLRLYEETLP